MRRGLPLLLVILGTLVGTTHAADRALHRDVVAALKEKDADARAMALERALRGADGPAAAGLILDRIVAQPRSELERSIALRALADMEDPEAVEAIRRVAEQPGELAVRAAVLEAVGDSTEPGTAASLQVAAAADDPRIRAAALSALARRDEENHDLVHAAGLLDDDWRVRSAAIWALAAGGRMTALPLLTDRLRQEEGRLVDDISAALAHLTGQRFGPAPVKYEVWWRDRQEGEPTGSPVPALRPWDPPAKTVDAPLLTSHSQQILFVLSTGNSMKDEVTAPDLSDGERLTLMALGEDLADEYDEAETKLELARVHLRAMLRSLRDGTLFDVATFAGSPSFAFGAPTAATDATRRKAETRIAKLSAGGGGNLSGMLERAFDPKGKDPIGADSGYDTIVLLSDGRLAAPGITSRQELAARLRRWSRVRQIRFVVVSVGASDDAVLGSLVAGPPRGVVRSIP